MALFRRRQPAETIKVLPSAERFETVTDTITSQHVFSAGAHYDPQRVGFGALVGLDAHTVQPGAGFDWHAHRGVDILSWVLAGMLRHEDDAGRVELVTPGEVLHQSCGSGVRHAETNASASEPLTFVQLTLVGASGAPACRVARPPLLVPGIGLFDVLTGKTELEMSNALLYVTRGSFNLTGHFLLPGDSARIFRTLQLSGSGELLVWTAGSRHTDASNEGST